LKVPDNSSGSAIRKNSDTPSSTHANSGGSGSWSWVSKLSKGVKTKVRVPSRKKTLPLSDAPPPLEAKKRVENWLSNPEKAESPIRNYTPAEQVDADFKGLLGDE
jgi:hypothetical protein